MVFTLFYLSPGFPTIVLKCHGFHHSLVAVLSGGFYLKERWWTHRSLALWCTNPSLKPTVRASKSMVTPPKFNSSPLKSYWAPKGEDRFSTIGYIWWFQIFFIFTPNLTMFQMGWFNYQLVGFWGRTVTLPWSRSWTFLFKIGPLPVLRGELFSFRIGTNPPAGVASWICKQMRGETNKWNL